MEQDKIIPIKCSLCGNPCCGCQKCVTERQGEICYNCYLQVLSGHNPLKNPFIEKKQLAVGLRGPVPLSRSKEDAPS